jgi:hypothetical protein
MRFLCKIILGISWHLCSIVRQRQIELKRVRLYLAGQVLQRTKGFESKISVKIITCRGRLGAVASS